MIRNYLLIAWRHIRKQPLYSAINITGLALGMAVAMLIGLWVWDELSFDHYHRNHGRLGEILSVGHFNGTVEVGAYSSVPLAAALRAQYPEDFAGLSLLAGTGENFRAGDKTIGEYGAWVEAGFPAMFSLSMVSGSVDALRDPSAVLLTASLAKSLFGTTDVAGKQIVAEDSMSLSVGGVYADLPANTTMSAYQFLLSWENKDNPGRAQADDWTDHHYQLFVQLKEHSDFAGVAAKIKDVTKPHIKGSWEEIGLHPMDKWHLYDRHENGQLVGGRLQSVRLFGVIGGLVLLLACINFMNLSTARSGKRAMETGIRKVLGSRRSQLIGQFLGESMLTVFLAFGAAFLLALLLLPLFNLLADKTMALPLLNPGFWLIVFCFVVFTGFVAGSYPAFFLSGFQPTRVLKGFAKAGRFASLPRKVLVVVQFTISISLMIGTVMVYRQLQFAKQRPVGYTREGLITLSTGRPEVFNHFEALRQELVQSGAITEMAESSSPTTEVRNSMLGYDWEGHDPRTYTAIGTLFVSADFGKTIGWTMREGRDFIPGHAADSGAFIINETAARFMGMKDPVGKVIRWHQVDHPIVGVVNDLVMESPYAKVEPAFFTLSPNIRIHYLILRINPALPVKEALAKIEPAVHRYDPDPLYYWFTDEAYGSKFMEEERTGRLAAGFAVLAVVISCMGLVGLASFVAEQRTKEMGIRKVLGAGVFHLWALLSKEFVGLVMVSFCIAAPVAWVVLDRWLRAYAYRVSLPMWVFVVTGVGSLFVTLVTVSAQSVRAARMDPVDSLRSE